MRRATLIIGLSLLVCTIASAREWVVAPAGNDKAAGTAQSPFGTIQHAVDVATPGDTIRVLAGLYRAPFLVEGKQCTRSRPLRIIAEGPVVIEGIEQGPAILLRNCQWVIVRGFVVRRVRQPIELRDCQNCSIEDSLVAETATVGIRLYDSTSCRVAHNFCTHANTGIYVGTGSTNNLIEGNLCAFNDASSENADGIASSDSRENTYRYNVLYRNNDDGLDMWTSMTNLVELNYSACNGDGKQGDGNGFKLGGRWHQQQNPIWIGGQNLVRWNVSANNMATGFSNNGSTGNQFMGNAAFGNGIGYDDVGIGGVEADAEPLLRRIRAYWQRQLQWNCMDWRRVLSEYAEELTEALRALGVEISED